MELQIGLTALFKFMKKDSSTGHLIVQGLHAITDVQWQQLAQLTQTARDVWHMAADRRVMTLSFTLPANVAEQLAPFKTARLLEKYYPGVSDYCFSQQLDCALLPADRSLADFRLLVMDMDSTLITIECLDEIADFHGCKPQVAAITEAAMRDPSIDFSMSLRKRVALLNGADATILEKVYTQRLELSLGAENMLAGIKRAGIKTLLVSGGFTFFTEKLKTRLGLDFVLANQLESKHQQLTGEVSGEIVDADVKARTVNEVCTALNITPQQAIVIGDGSNDLKMMQIAGLSVAFRAKPIVRASTDIAFNFIGLDGLLTLLNAEA